MLSHLIFIISCSSDIWSAYRCEGIGTKLIGHDLDSPAASW